MKKILVVDDEMELVQLCRFVLEEAGYSVRGAYNGVQALTQVEQDMPDLILLDVMMPEMDGIEVCRRISKNYDQDRQCTIIMYTADDSGETRQNSLEAGAKELVSKQTPIFELAQKIEDYLN